MFNRRESTESSSCSNSREFWPSDQSSYSDSTISSLKAQEIINKTSYGKFDFLNKKDTQSRGTAVNIIFNVYNIRNVEKRNNHRISVVTFQKSPKSLGPLPAYLCAPPSISDRLHGKFYLA